MIHNKPQPASCRNCRTVCNSFQVLEYHLKNVKCQKPTGVLAYQKPDQLTQNSNIIVKNINRYKCQMPHCDQRFEKLATKNEHQRLCMKDNKNPKGGNRKADLNFQPVSCRFCQTRFNYLSAFEQHYKIAHENDEIEKRKNREINLEKEKNSVQKENNQMKINLTQNSLKQLQNDLHKATCTICKKVFTTDPELKVHMDQFHTENTKKQEENNQKTIVKLSMDDLKKLQTNLQMLKGAQIQPMCCRACKKEFSYLPEFQKHFQTTHPMFFTKVNNKSSRKSENWESVDSRGHLTTTWTNVRQPVSCRHCKTLFNKKTIFNYLSAFQRHYRNVHESDEIEKNKNRKMNLNKQLNGPVRVEKPAQSQLIPRDEINSTAKLIKGQLNSE